MIDDTSTHIIKRNDITYRFVINNIQCKKNGIVIFFTSVKPQSAIEQGIYPYYARLSWSKHLNQYCTIFVADPFELSSLCNDTHGSWFINSDGQSVFSQIGFILNDIIGENHGPIIAYGSSMGGYAALLCSYFIGADAVIAEAPQLNLYEYPSSKRYLSKVADPDVFMTDVFYFLTENTPCYSIDIFINIGDTPHIQYVISNICNSKFNNYIKNIDNLHIQIYSCKGKFGHVSMDRSQAIKNILSKFQKINREQIDSIDISDFLLINFGSYTNNGFVLKLRGEYTEINNKPLMPAKNIEMNRLANILMCRYAASYIQQLPLAAKVLEPELAIDIIFGVYTQFSSHDLMNDAMVCGNILLSCIALNLNLKRHNIICRNSKLLIKIIDENINRLDMMKMSVNNHSLRGLYALLIASKYGFSKNKNDIYITKIRDMFFKIFNDEGFCVENSSEYHMYNLRDLLTQFLRTGFFYNTDLSDLKIKSEGVAKNLFCSLDAGFAFGDSDPLVMSKHAKHFYEKNENCVSIYPNSGLAFSRGFNDAVCFTNFFHHGGIHNHSDYCSFEWFADGHWIIIDPGKYLYGKTLEGLWFKSSQAHNTIDVDALNHDTKVSLKTITGIYNQAGSTLTGTITDNNFIFKREIKHSNCHLLIKDLVTFNKKISCINSQLMISPDFKFIKQNGDVIYFTDSMNNKLNIYSKLNSRLYKGSEHPFYGWCAPTYGTYIPTTQIVFEKKVSESSVDYEIELEYIKHKGLA